jgi:hypothetical protein
MYNAAGTMYYMSILSAGNGTVLESHKINASRLGRMGRDVRASYTKTVGRHATITKVWAGKFRPVVLSTKYGLGLEQARDISMMKVGYEPTCTGCKDNKC